jgi:hypothetical protein
MMRLWIVALALLAGCPGRTTHPTPPGVGTVQDVLARLAKARNARTSFRVQTTMDYWLGKNRAKGTVFVMGTSTRQVRFNALNPTGGVLIDMACNGSDFTYVDFQNNCSLVGPCNKSSIGNLLRVDLEPDDFHHLAQGTPPLLDGATGPAPTGSVTWDSNKGHARVKLEGAAGTQNLVIDAKDNRFDVLSAELVGKDGKVVWSVENTDFTTIKDEKGVGQRVPGKTRFKSPQQQADLLVEWKSDERKINLALDAAKFTVPIPPGLPTCGAATAPAPKASLGPKTP